jgi:proteasome component ECM29
MADTSEERELQLIDKLELRIALAKDDTKLETLLKTYLCPLLLKLTSPHLNVRNKVMRLLLLMSL